MDPTKKSTLSDLPWEILGEIERRFDDPVDIRRWRRVRSLIHCSKLACSSVASSIPPLCSDCSSVASSIPPLCSDCSSVASPIPPASRLPVQIPLLRGPGGVLHSSTSVGWSTVYALEKLEGEGAASGPERWLLKLEETDRSGPEGTKMRMLDLFSRRFSWGQTAYWPRNLPKELNSLEFRIVKICREYRLDNDQGPVEGIYKVVMLPDRVCSDLNQCSVYFIDTNGVLGHWKNGDENWTYLDDSRNCGSYDDIAVYEGRACVVDKNRSVCQIGSCSQCFSSPGSGGNHVRPNRTYLVESGDDLYMVDKYIGANLFFRVDSRLDDFKVYRLDRRTNKWEEAISLGNSAFFLGNRCSSAVPACKLGESNWNCIYYTREADSIFSPTDDVKVFNLVDGTSEFLRFCDFAWSFW